MDMYELARGPLAWISFLVFGAGCVAQIVSILKKPHQKRMVYPAISIKGGGRSILHGILPFGSFYMRQHPALTIATAVFHIGILAVPVFLLAHVVLWYESWKLLWWSLPDIVADIMTIGVMLACVFFFARRLSVPAVKKVTRPGDFLLLVAVLAPFLSGFLAAHQIGPYRPMLVLHVVSGELLLMLIPFSRLRHMVLFWFSKAYMGAEFGRVLQPRDW